MLGNKPKRRTGLNSTKPDYSFNLGLPLSTDRQVSAEQASDPSCACLGSDGSSVIRVRIGASTNLLENFLE